jgi:hypothetical protein
MGARREVKIDPTQTRREKNKRLEAARTRRSKYTCPLCDREGHYRNQCFNPHRLCAKRNQGYCILPLAHPHWVDDAPINCPWEGDKREGASEYSFEMSADESITRA